MTSDDVCYNESAPALASPNTGHLDRQGQADEDDKTFHEQAHRKYRAAKNYVDASLRDNGYQPANVRAVYPHQYAQAVRRAYRATK